MYDNFRFVVFALIATAVICVRAWVSEPTKHLNCSCFSVFLYNFSIGSFILTLTAFLKCSQCFEAKWHLLEYTQQANDTRKVSIEATVRHFTEISRFAFTLLGFHFHRFEAIERKLYVNWKKNTLTHTRSQVKKTRGLALDLSSI